MSGPRLEVRLEETLGDFHLSVAFQVQETGGAGGGAVALFGPSGAGKTTVLEHIAGWRRPTSGYVRVGERVLLDTGRGICLPREGRGVGYVPQDVLLFPHWDVGRNVAAGLARARGDRRPLEAALEVLELSGLLERRVQTLSGGERQRVALARALASGPDLLLLDEPLGALDLPLRRRILPYLVRVRERFEVPILLVTHDPTEVLALCDRVVVLGEGTVRCSGAPTALLSGPALGATTFENVLRGEVLETGAGTARVRLPGGGVFRIPAGDLAPGDRALFGLRADDVLVSRRPVQGLSARNCVPARVESVVGEGNDVHVLARPGALEGGPLEGGPTEAPLVWVSLTREAVVELALEAGVEVWLVVKTQACHPLA